LRLLAHPGRVDQADGAVFPVAGSRHPVDGDGIARDPRFRPGQQAILAQQAIDKRRFSGIRTTNDRQFQNRPGIVFRFVLAPFFFLFGFTDQGSRAWNKSASPSPCSAEKAIGSPKPSA
jgi:hypothetical protein